MKASILALTVLAVALPGVALAVEPMSDGELDSVVAGFTIIVKGNPISSLPQAIAAIRAHPADFQKTAAQNSALYFQNEAAVKKVLPSDLWYLLPQQK